MYVVSLYRLNKKANLKAYSIDLLIPGYRKKELSTPLTIQNIDVNELEDKYLDDEPGSEEVRNFLNLDELSIYLQDYSVFGQYNLNTIYKLEPIIPKFDLDIIKKEINSITTKLGSGLVKKYNEEKRGENYLQYRCSSHNDFFCIQICTVYLRLVRFDDYQRHPSNPKYRDYFPPVDDLFNNLDSLLAKLEEMYPNSDMT